MAHRILVAPADSYFEIGPRYVEEDGFLTDKKYISRNNKVTFCHQSFDLDEIESISEVFMVSKTLYRYSVTLRTGRIIEFDLESKKQAIASHKELQRAYCETGEFSRENLQATEEASGDEELA